VYIRTDNSTAKVGSSVDETEKPLVFAPVRSSFCRDQTELRSPEQVGTVRNRLVLKIERTSEHVRMWERTEEKRNIKLTIP
jgi:hypothetical protein